MYYIGIDIAKKFNYAGIFNETNILMTTHLKFDNSKAGFKRVSEYLKSKKIKTTNCIILYRNNWTLSPKLISLFTR